MPFKVIYRLGHPTLIRGSLMHSARSDWQSSIPLDLWGPVSAADYDVPN